MNAYIVKRPWHYADEIIVLATNKKDAKREALKIVNRRYPLDKKTEVTRIRKSGILSVHHRAIVK